MSTFSAPPGTTAPTTTPPTPPSLSSSSVQPLDHPLDQHQPFDSVQDAAAAAAMAHQGLRALQAAPAATSPLPSPVQYGTPLTTPHETAYAVPAPHNQQQQPHQPHQPQQQQQPPQKMTRLRRACDMCSQRKVKCDESGPPCRQCRELKVDCTFHREMRRRGPPNKHAEAAKAAKRPRLEPSHSPVHSPIVPPSGAELIAPWPVLELLVDDFFSYIHPLTPFPHEPSFRAALAERRDRTSGEFLALLASMVGSLVASFPRAVRLHLTRQRSGHLFPRATAMTDRCHAVALEARGAHFAAREDVTVDDAATSYFLGLAAGYSLRWKLFRRYMGEAMTLVRELGYTKPRDLGLFSPYHDVDHIQDQIGKRIFWTLFLGIRSVAQLGAPQGEIVLPPPTPTAPYPEFPAEVDDQYILRHQILGQPQGTVSLLTGFNQAIKIYMTMNGLVSVELSYGIATLPWADQKAMLDDCLQATNQVMHGLPPELTLDLDAQPADERQQGTAAGDPFAPAYQYPSASSDDILGPPDDGRPLRRRLLQYEIQKANIYASQLATRSYYVERYLNLRDAHRQHSREQAAAADSSENDSKVAAAAVRAAAEQADAVDAAMTAERELIVRHLVAVLAKIPQRNLEPNGGSIINKIRQVASTLLNDPPERKGPVAVRADSHLAGFVDVLMRLEKTGSPGGQPGKRDDEEELRNWADLREHQQRFARNGGFLMPL